MFGFTSDLKIVEAITPQAGAAITGDYVSLKNAIRAWVVVHINQAAANTVAISIEQATVVAGTDSKVLTDVCPIWANEDCATLDALVAQTAAKNFTTSAATTHKVVIFEINPAECMDIAGNFDCITVKTGASAAGNITSAMYYLETKNPAATPPTAITD